MTALRPMETLTRTAAFGIRFRDAATATSVIDGLRVEIYPHLQPQARRIAQANRSGVYVAHALPGLRDFEFSDEEPDVLWARATRPYRVEVRDPLGRFLPMAFDADLPARGLFSWRAPWISPPQPFLLPGEPGSPPQLMLQGVPLFSSPSRAVPDPLAVVRAQLWDDVAQREAAWALLAVVIDGETHGLGLADERGRVAVLFPYPEPARMRLSSPPEQRDDFAWLVELRAFARTDSPTLAASDIADLGEVLASLDSPRGVIESHASPDVPYRLTYRQELTVRTAGAVGAHASFLSLSA